MKRKVEYIFAGYGGKPVYVQGFLANDSGRVQLEVVSSNPEPRPKPGVYAAKDLPGGWIRLLPEDGATKETDVSFLAEAKQAGFEVMPMQ